MTGELTILGTTKRIQLDVEIGGIVNDPWGNTRAGFSMTGKIDRTTFGMATHKIIGDEVNLNCSCEGIVKK
jgi:polyisoprenoid-binding protein YceI